MEDERCQRRLSFETTFRTEKELGIIKSLDPEMIWHPNFVKYGWRGTASQSLVQLSQFRTDITIHVSISLPY